MPCRIVPAGHPEGRESKRRGHMKMLMEKVLVLLLVLSGEAWTATLTLQRSSISVPVDSQVVVKVAIDNVRMLHAFSIVIGYDPQIVRCKKVKSNNFWGASTFLFTRIDSVNGSVQVDEALLGASGQSGSGYLLEMTFGGRNTGHTNLTFAVAELRDTANAVVAVQTVNSELQVGPVTGVASPGTTVAASPELTNYPNPFNPTTNIGYSVGVVSSQSPVASMVRLAVYDLIGREVKVLVDEMKEPGEYRVTFDGRNLPSGSYIVRLTTATTSGSRKILLIR
jgi:hypothetical protein